MQAGQEEGHCRCGEHEDHKEEQQSSRLPGCQSWLHHTLAGGCDLGRGLVCLSEPVPFVHDGTCLSGEPNELTMRTSYVST